MTPPGVRDDAMHQRDVGLAHLAMFEKRVQMAMGLGVLGENDDLADLLVQAVDYIALSLQPLGQNPEKGNLFAVAFGD